MLLIAIYKLPYKTCRFFDISKKVITYPIGCDTLYPFAKYSEGAIPRKEFIKLYIAQKTRKLTTEEVHKAGYDVEDVKLITIAKYAIQERQKSWIYLAKDAS